MSAAPIVLGITIRADGSAQVSGEINRIREAVTGAGSAAQNTNRQFAQMATAMASAEQAAAAIHTRLANANAIYDAQVARLTLSTRAYRAYQLQLEGLHPSQIRHIQDLEATRTASVQSSTAISKLGTVMSAFGLTIGLIGLAGLAKNVVDTNREMESLRAQLKALTGSTEEAQRTFEFITRFATNTPFEINGLTKSFVMLQNFGIKPTEQVMSALTNQAAKLGGSQEILSGITLALGQAYSKGKLQAEEMNQLVERGVPVYKLLAEVTGKNTSELQDMSAKGEITREVIDKLIIKMGEFAAGGNAAAMDTLNGKISNLADAWHQFEDALMNDKSEGFIKSIVSSITETLNILTRNMSDTLDAQIAHAEARVKTFDGLGMAGSFVSDMSGYDINVEKNKIDGLKRLKEKQDNAHKEVEINNARATAIAQTNEWLSGIETTDSEAAAERLKKQEKDSAKSAKSALDDAKRKAEAINKNIADELSGLDDQHQKLTLSKRDYYAQSDAIKAMTPAQKAWAMAQWDVNNAQEVQNKGIDFAKNKLAELKDQYDLLKLSARDYLAASMIANKVPEAEQKTVLAQFDKTTSAAAEKEKANVAKKAHEDATNALQKYNDTVDSTNQKTQDLGSINSAIFDGALGGINTLVGALGSMSDELSKNSTEMDRLSKVKDDAFKMQPNMDKDVYLKDLATKTDATKKSTKEIADLDKKSVYDAMTGTRQVAAAAAKMFGEKTVAAKAFHAIENGIAVAQMAMKVKDMAISSMATVKSFIAGAAKMFEQSGWLGFAGVAAMAALMAGLGFSMSGGGGGSSAPPPSETGTGTVLGDSSAKSESLTRTNDLLKSIHASEYVQLRGINAGVNNLNRSILNTVTKVFQGGGLSSFSLTQSDALTGLTKTISTVNSVLTLGMSSLVSKIPLIGGIFDKVNNFLFGGKQTQSITGQGIQTFGTSLSDVVSGRNVRANQYADIKTHTTGGLFGSSKDSYATSYQAIGGDIQKALNDVFSNVGTNLMMVAKSLGHGLTETVSKAIIPAMRIDLMGLSGENAAKKLNNVISATMDKMSSAIFGKIVGQYQQLGEGMFETAVRVVAQIELVKDAVSQSGLKILEKDIISVSNTLVTAAGGLEAFQAQFEAYYDKFYTEAEKQQRLQTRLTETMKEAALILPATREGYRKLMEALDLTNALDQQRYTLLLELSGAADTYYSGLEKSSKVMEKQRSLDIKIMELSGNTLGALIESRKDEMAALDESLRFSQSAVNALTDANKAVADATTAANKAVSDSLSAASKSVSAAVSDVSKAIGNLSTLANKLRSSLADNAISTIDTAKKDRVDAQAVLNAALEIAKSGGSIDNFAGMDKAIADISKPSAQLYATFEEYAIDQAHTGSTITQLADYADTQISMAQLQIDAINNTTTAVNSVAGSLASLTDAQKNLATVQDQKDQIDKMLKNNIAVLSVSEAITQLSAALGVQNATTQAIAVAQQAAKTTAAAELVMNTANTKASASASALSTAKTSVQTASDTAASLATADAAAVVKAQSNIKGLESLRDIFASVGDWATYFAYQSSIDKANKKLALLTIAAANSATSAATAAQEVLTGASYAGLTATAAADAAAAVDARAAYQTALAYSNAAAAAVPNGSHKNGLDYVPFDGYVAELHKGERVLTANENLAMSAPRNNQNNVELLMELRMLRKEVEQLRLESKAGNSAIAENTKTTSKTLVKWDIDGTPAVTA